MLAHWRAHGFISELSFLFYWSVSLYFLQGSLLSLTTRNAPGGLLQSQLCQARQGIKTHFNIRLRQLGRPPSFREESVRKWKKNPVYSECNHIDCQTVHHSQRSSTGQLTVSRIHICYFPFFSFGSIFSFWPHCTWHVNLPNQGLNLCPVVEAQSRNPRTTRGVHICYFLMKYLHELFGSPLLMFG